MVERDPFAVFGPHREVVRSGAAVGERTGPGGGEPGEGTGPVARQGAGGFVIRTLARSPARAPAGS
jgi:hypothetical protein